MFCFVVFFFLLKLECFEFDFFGNDYKKNIEGDERNTLINVF
jgi:hypothetical protein